MALVVASERRSRRRSFGVSEGEVCVVFTQLYFSFLIFLRWPLPVSPGCLFSLVWCLLRPVCRAFLPLCTATCRPPFLIRLFPLYTTVVFPCLRSDTIVKIYLVRLHSYSRVVQKLLLSSACPCVCMCLFVRLSGLSSLLSSFLQAKASLPLAFFFLSFFKPRLFRNC